MRDRETYKFLVLGTISNDFIVGPQECPICRVKSKSDTGLGGKHTHVFRASECVFKPQFAALLEVNY